MIVNMFDLNSPYTWSGGFKGKSLGKKLVIGSFETPEYYASKGLVRPWQRNRPNSLMVKKVGKRPVIGDWKNDTLDGKKKIEDQER
jgi:hypothetical protein